MKPYFTTVTSNYENAVTIRYDEMEVFYPHWHYHDEYELVYIHKSAGIRYVGDSINPYQPGDLVLLGSLLPHIWINKVEEEREKSELAAATVIHFQPEFVHNGFFDLPDMKILKDLFEQSVRGIRFIHFPGIEEYLQLIQSNTSTDRIIAVLSLLTQLCKHDQYEFLSSKNYHRIALSQRNDRLSKVHNFIAGHFREKIKLNTLASIAHMSPHAFCGYFKRKTGKTVFTYINDLRIGYSCKLLIETELTIDHIALQSGFNSTTFYNRKFKSTMLYTPGEYRKKHKYKLLYRHK